MVFRFFQQGHTSLQEDHTSDQDHTSLVKEI